MYDLPAQLTTWHYALGRTDQDFGREEGLIWLERFLMTQHRVADPNRADYFVVPIAGGPGVKRMRALRYARERWPFFNRSVEAGVANHVFPAFCDDGGWSRGAPCHRSPPPKRTASPCLDRFC